MLHMHDATLGHCTHGSDGSRKAAYPRGERCYYGAMAYPYAKKKNEVPASSRKGSRGARTRTRHAAPHRLYV